MADNYEYDIEDDEDDFNDTGLVKKLRKQIDGLQKQLKERESLIEEFTTYSHEASVGEILESFGLNARIAQFIPSDVEADPDAVAEWLNEYGDAFGIEAVEEGGEAVMPLVLKPLKREGKPPQMLKHMSKCQTLRTENTTHMSVRICNLVLQTPSHQMS